MALGDGIRRNVAHVDPSERAMLRDAILEMHHRFYRVLETAATRAALLPRSVR